MRISSTVYSSFSTDLSPIRHIVFLLLYLHRNYAVREQENCQVQSSTINIFLGIKLLQLMIESILALASSPSSCFYPGRGGGKRATLRKQDEEISIHLCNFNGRSRNVTGNLHIFINRLRKSFAET